MDHIPMDSERGKKKTPKHNFGAFCNHMAAIFLLPEMA